MSESSQRCAVLVVASVAALVGCGAEPVEKTPAEMEKNRVEQAQQVRQERSEAR